jgi:hypothetical protein
MGWNQRTNFEFGKKVSTRLVRGGAWGRGKGGDRERKG